MTTERKIVLIKEQCETELQILIQVAFISLQPLQEVRARAKKIIEKYSKQIEKAGGPTYKELAKKIKKGFIQSFNRWCIKLLNQLARLINKGQKVYYIAYTLLRSGTAPDPKKLKQALEDIGKLGPSGPGAAALQKTPPKEHAVASGSVQKKILEAPKEEAVKVHERTGGTFDLDMGDVQYKLETTDDLRQFLTSGETGYSQMFIEQYTDRVQQTMNEIIATGATLVEKENANGVVAAREGKRPTSLRNLAELEVRYQERNKTLGKLVDEGINYCVCSQHNNASARCQNLQGLIYKIDCDENYTEKKPILLGKNHLKPIGHIDGKPYYSLKEAISHGLLGYNCRHRLIQYKKGMETPKPIPDREITKERDIELKQRELERKVRYCKKKQALAQNPAERKKWVNQSKLWQKKYDDFCRQHNLVIEKWRCSITENEREYL